MSDQEETSELESTVVKMMRMQYGLMAGGAKGFTEMGRMMETFIDTLADKTDLKKSEDWREMMESTPDALVTATRKTLDRGDKVAQEVVDTFHRYSKADE